MPTLNIDQERMPPPHTHTRTQTKLCLKKKRIFDTGELDSGLELIRPHLLTAAVPLTASQPRICTRDSRKETNSQTRHCPSYAHLQPPLPPQLILGFLLLQGDRYPT